MTTFEPERTARLSRRRFLGAGAAGGATLALGLADTARAGGVVTAPPARVVPFYGRHQAGIATPAPSQLVFAAYDLLPEATAGDVRLLLRRWSDAAARLSAGDASGSGPVPNPAAAPRDA